MFFSQEQTSDSNHVTADNDYQKEKKYIDVGTHTLRLYKPPVPDPVELPLSAYPVPGHWVRYGRANVRIHITQGKPTDDSLPPSDADTDDEEDCPQVLKPQFATMPKLHST